MTSKRLGPPSSIDHIEFPVLDSKRSRAFYEAALEPLGISLIIEIGRKRFGFGGDSYPRIWFHQGQPAGPIHLAVAAASQRAVDGFYEAAMKAGGRDNGPPGIRARYHSNYYAAYVLDPDGNNIEAVYQG